MQHRGFAVGILTFVLLAAVGWLLVDDRSGVSMLEVEVVDHAVDGDTLMMADGALVRVIGLDAPETNHPDMTGPEPLGPEASVRTAALADGARVRLEADAEARDKYGRKLAHVWIDDRLLSEILIEEGLGQVMTIPPNVRHRSLLEAAEDRARASGMGMWAGLPTPIPAFGGRVP